MGMPTMRNIDQIEKKISTKKIQSQNNSLEINREVSRLEKLFYFYRDVEEKIGDSAPLNQIKILRQENEALYDRVIKNCANSDSKFIDRLSRIWEKFLSK